MPQNYGIIAQQVGTTSLAAMYTVPALTQIVISGVVVCNFSGSASSFTIKFAKAGAVDTDAHYIYAGVAIPMAETFIATTGFTLNATDEVRISAGNNSALAFNLFGSIVTP